MKKQNLKILMFLTVFFTISCILNNTNSGTPVNNEGIIIEEENADNVVKLPQSSWYNNSESPIAIDDASGTNDWTWARSQPWCQKGDGSESNPYVIENITIDAFETANPILINNSNVH